MVSNGEIVCTVVSAMGHLAKYFVRATCMFMLEQSIQKLNLMSE
jgi:hypothetical protein